MSPDDFANLKSSIAVGFDSTLGKIILFENCILDGWNRYKACNETNVNPVFENFEGNEQEAFEFSIKANQDRRHLTSGQLATVATDAEELWTAIQENVEIGRVKKREENRLKKEAERKEEEKRKQEAIERENQRIEREKLADEAEKLRIEEEREKERLAEIEKEKARVALMPHEDIEAEIHVAELIPPHDKRENESRTKLAKIFGTNERYIQDAKKLKASNPEQFEAVKRGEKTY